MWLNTALTDVLNGFRSRSVGGVPLRATADPNGVVTPCVFVPMPAVSFRLSKACADVSWEAFLVASQSGGQTATGPQLSDMLDAVIGLFPFVDGQMYALTLPGAVGGPQAPAYRLTWSDTIRMGALTNGND